MNTKQIEQLAKAGKLRFNDSDVAQWSETMEKIFVWLDQLAEVDTSSVKITDLDPEYSYVRSDNPVVSPDREAVLAGVAELEDNMIKVKKVL
ncbi:aspartyl/glutamyl-tRNA(Asn/Gln) amidotransferase C subunit [Elusimicrobium posterum]|uniref:Asp-tRNA(Asn)/Glu-tRNA(Gln) amidotransferase subunit GatC n=1 Tax=Elusimicrobium posterum TaxID=3116653 RepID=UPI003C71DCC4